MPDTDRSSRPQVRPEQERGRSTRQVMMGAALLMVLFNAARLFADGDAGALGGAAALSVVIVVLGVAWNRRVAGGLKTIASREQLRVAADGARGMRRMNLVWYEYVIAKNVARNTYHDEPPMDFKSDVYDASMRMGMGTRYSLRQIGWLSVFFVVLAFVIPLMVVGDDIAFALLMSAGLLVLFAVSIGITLLFIRAKSRTPLSQLGRRIEGAAELDGETRWLQLLEIAREEATLEGTHS